MTSHRGRREITAVGGRDTFSSAPLSSASVGVFSLGSTFKAAGYPRKPGIAANRATQTAFLSMTPVPRTGAPHPLDGLAATRWGNTMEWTPNTEANGGVLGGTPRRD